MALKGLAVYYSCGCDSADLFKGRKIECDDSFLECLNKYDVIYLNMQQFMIEFDREQCIWKFQKAETEFWKQLSFGRLAPRRAQ